MSAGSPEPAGVATTAPATPIADRPRFGIHSIEDAALSIALVAMVVLPLAEGMLRSTLHTGITGASIIVQHLGLLVGMIGGAIAAREGRLLALSTVGDTVLRGRTKRIGRIFYASVSALIAAFLAVAGQRFVENERSFGKILVYGIPVWAIELALPVGFAVIAVRLLYRASETWRDRFAAAALASVMGVLVLTVPEASTRLFVPALLVLAVAVVIGAPAFVALGGTALILFWWIEVPIAAIPISHYSLVMNPTIPTLPLFTLAGYLLAESRAPARLVRVFNALFGRFRGGPAVVTVLVCAFFTSFTGASGVTILALGGLLMPILLEARYSEKDALGLITGAGSMGMLLPPCLPVIVYAIIARVDLKAMFLGGFVPALLMIVVTAWWGVRRGPRAIAARAPFDARKARAALWDAKWELLTPFVALGALFSGLGTPVEAAALTALYVLIVETALHRDLHVLRDVPRVMTECGLLVGGILLVTAQVADRAVEWTTATIHSPILFLLLLNVFLLIVGCLMDIYSAIIIQVPLLVPLGVAFGVDPIQLGIIFLSNLELGYLTPPVGLNLYMSSYRFGKPVPTVLMSVLPIIIVLHIGTLLITYIPPLTTALPRWFGY
ncbi:MAG: C4-dicarboxylate ABC transporter permease [Acidobacteria bacterium]|nr:MAG: C4-dicarboxylate ABC transporter permease [Acidobacteriota bacterium]